MYKTKIITIFLILWFISFFYTYNNANAEITTLNRSKYLDKCYKNNTLISYIKLTGLLSFITCADGLPVCELLFKPDKHQNFDYVPVYKVYDLDDYLTFPLVKKYRNFNVIEGAPVIITIKRTMTYVEHNTKNPYCYITDDVVSIDYYNSRSRKK